MSAEQLNQLSGNEQGFTPAEHPIPSNQVVFEGPVITGDSQGIRVGIGRLFRRGIPPHDFIEMQGVLTPDFKSDQNSPVRKISGMLAKAMEYLPPGVRIHPDRVNDAGVVGVLIGTAIAAYAGSRKSDQQEASLKLGNHEIKAADAATAIVTFANILDAFDGPAAKVYPDQTKVDKINGAVRDHKADMWKTLIMKIGEIYLAHQDEDLLGEVTAAISAITGPVTKITKAHRISKDHVVVPELGLGSALIKVPADILALASRVYPVLRKYHAQTAIDLFTSGASVETGIGRMKYDPSERPDKHHKQPTNQDVEIAEKKLKASYILGAVTVVATVGTLAFLHRPKR